MKEKELKFDSWRYVLFTGFNEMLDYGKELEKEKIETSKKVDTYSKWLDEQIKGSNDVGKKEAFSACKEKLVDLFELKINKGGSV